MTSILSDPPDSLSAEILVLGSGPGGTTTACALAEAGRDVLLIEEGPHVPPDAIEPFSRPEMEQKYRNGGLTVAFGATQVQYVEGRCVGGGSEVNSGLYHRTPADILAEWRERFRVEAFTQDDLCPHFEAIERDLSVSKLVGPAPPASLKLHEGATRLGWNSIEVPRWFRYVPLADGSSRGLKQTMTRTLVRAPSLPERGSCPRREPRESAVWSTGGKFWPTMNLPMARRRLKFDAKTVFLACGAIQTPSLLLRSGLAQGAGDTLHFHPTIKMVARFPEEINRGAQKSPCTRSRSFRPASAWVARSAHIRT